MDRKIHATWMARAELRDTREDRETNELPIRRHTLRTNCTPSRRLAQTNDHCSLKMFHLFQFLQQSFPSI